MSPPRDRRWLARGAALASAAALAWVPGGALLARTLGGRSTDPALRSVLLIAVPYLVVALLPWPPARAGRRWFPLLVTGVAFVGPIWGIAVLAPLGVGHSRTLPVAVLAQVALLYAGVSEFRRQGPELGQPRFSAALWALVLTALSPGVWIGVIVALVGTHGHGTVGPTIGDLRSIISAEAAYTSFGDGYGRPECLERPTACRPDYPPEAVAFLPASELVLVRRGYLRTFHPLPRSEPSEDPTVGLEGFAILAVPLDGHAALPAFCADHTGLICIYREGSVPRVDAGGCPEGCEPVL